MADIKKNWFESLKDDMKAKAKELHESFKSYQTEFASQPPPASAADGTLKDGTPFKYTGDKLDKGSIITVVTDAGEVPMPDGEYLLPDDTTMIVVNDGTNAVVNSIEPAGVPEEQMGADAKNLADVKERVTKIVEKFEAQFKAQHAIISKQTIQIENLKLKQGKLAKDLQDTFSVVEAFGEIETGTPEEKPGNGKLSAHDKKMNLITKK